MHFADEAFLARRRGKEDLARDFFEKAFRAEKEAAEQVTDSDLEPTRSVLCRSAATLALDCGLTREAEKLISVALAGEPPFAIAEELRDLQERVQFKRHLRLRGIVLDDNEVQVSFLGKAIGTGFALTRATFSRVVELEKIVKRTTERVNKLKFRERSGPQKLSDLYVSAPRAGSFCLTLKIGLYENPRLPNFGNSDQVIDELMVCMDLLERQEMQGLRDQIDDPAYFGNFVSLAKKVAPDGEDITMVGLTALRYGKEKNVSFSRQRDEIPDFTSLETRNSQIETTDEIKEVSGVLRYANAMRDDREVKLVVNKGKPWTILVPKGLMEDIVTPHWEKPVNVRGYKVKKRQKTLQLVDILETREEQSPLF